MKKNMETENKTDLSQNDIIESPKTESPDVVNESIEPEEIVHEEVGKKRKSSSIKNGKIKEAITGYLFVSPLIIYMAIFLIAPMAMALYYSFLKGVNTPRESFVGVDNYIALLTNKNDLYPEFYKSLTVTLKYIVLTVPANIVLALVVSALLNSKVKAERFFKTSFYIPSVTVGVAIMAMWRYMVDPTFGLINQLFGTNLNFLGNENYALPTIAIMSIWGSLGYNVLIMLSAMKNIDPALYEAASIDGANAFQKFIRVTVPQVMPTTFFLVITGLIGAFQVFDQAYFLTGGGPNQSTYTYMFGVYNRAFGDAPNLGIASAMSYILFAIILVITIIQFKVLPQGEYKQKGVKKSGRK